MSELFNVIQTLTTKQNTTFFKGSIIERATEETKKMYNLSETVRQLHTVVSETTKNITFLENKLKILQSQNNELCENVAELQQYSHRWNHVAELQQYSHWLNLKIQGVSRGRGRGH